ncbi:hypothetical protein QZH41_013885, partial [Actinostola sp. cb2023]
QKRGHDLISWAILRDVSPMITKDQLFQFDGLLYEQFDGVAMGSPLGPLLANVFMCSIEEDLRLEGYDRFVWVILCDAPLVSSCPLKIKKRRIL